MPEKKMASKAEAENRLSREALLYRLIKKVVPESSESRSKSLLGLLKKILDSGIALNASNQVRVVESIEKKLVQQHRAKDAVCFSECLRKLQKTGAVKDMDSILTLLYKLSNLDGAIGRPALSLSAHHLATSAQQQSASSSRSLSTREEFLQSTPLSQVSSIEQPRRAALFHHAAPENSLQSFLSDEKLSQNYSNEKSDRPVIASHVSTMSSISHSKMVLDSEQEHSEMPTVISLNKSLGASKPSMHSGLANVSEQHLIQELMFVLQGIPTKTIQYNVEEDTFKIDAALTVSDGLRESVEKFSQCGWLYKKIMGYIDDGKCDEVFGVVGQSFLAALQQEMSEYYRLVGVLEAQLNEDQDAGLGAEQSLPSSLTLHRLAVWLCQPLQRLKMLAILLEHCQGKRGAALLTDLYACSKHGMQSIAELIQHKLLQAATPYNNILMRWLNDGDLDDPFEEFFVVSSDCVIEHDMWKKKFSVVESRVPAFVGQNLAITILQAGKSLHFLRYVCDDFSPLSLPADTRLALNEADVKWLCLPKQERNKLAGLIHQVAAEASKHVLHVMYTRYQLMHHFKAMRRYFLLGQGDFIRHLMDLLEVEMGKPAKDVFMHNLSGALEDAIRDTNAQYDEPDVLQRLDVKQTMASPGDVGWDVFGLAYSTAGPIGTIFSERVMQLYLSIFTFLWRTKRLEYGLCSLWKVGMTYGKALIDMPEVFPLLHHCHLLTTAMLHFMQEIQYFTAFEVMECSWTKLCESIKKAQDLDAVISAHDDFLALVTQKLLLDRENFAILGQLRACLDIIVKFSKEQDSLYTTVMDELERRKEVERERQKKSKQGRWAITEEEETVETENLRLFSREVLSAWHTKVFILGKSFQDMVQMFLEKVNESPDDSLHCLAFRLDFNDFYSSQQPAIRSSLLFSSVHG